VSIVVATTAAFDLAGNKIDRAALIIANQAINARGLA